MAFFFKVIKWLFNCPKKMDKNNTNKKDTYAKDLQLELIILLLVILNWKDKFKFSKLIHSLIRNGAIYKYVKYFLSSYHSFNLIDTLLCKNKISCTMATNKFNLIL